MTINNDSWHIWLINPNRFLAVKKHLEDNVKEVEEVLYPTAIKEYKDGRGTLKKKHIPLYAGYLFLKYEDSPNIFYKIAWCPFVNRYLGKCLGENLKDIKKMREVEKWNAAKNIAVGDVVSVNGGPLKGMEGAVFMVSSNKVFINVSIFGRDVKTEVLVDDVSIVEKAVDVSGG